MNTTLQSRCHKHGTCCMDSTCSRRFECAMEARENTPHSDEQSDQPIFTPEGCESLTSALAGLLLIALASMFGGLYLLWTHDATLRPALHQAWETVQLLFWAAMPLFG